MCNKLLILFMAILFVVTGCKKEKEEGTANIVPTTTENAQPNSTISGQDQEVPAQPPEQNVEAQNAQKVVGPQDRFFTNNMAPQSRIHRSAGKQQGVDQQAAADAVATDSVAFPQQPPTNMQQNMQGPAQPMAAPVDGSQMQNQIPPHTAVYADGGQNQQQQVVPPPVFVNGDQYQAQPARVPVAGQQHNVNGNMPMGQQPAAAQEYNNLTPPVTTSKGSGMQGQAGGVAMPMPSTIQQNQ